MNKELLKMEVKKAARAAVKNSSKDRTPKYNVYYMDNDRQKRIVAKDLSYSAAVQFMQKNYRTYGAELQKELI